MHQLHIYFDLNYSGKDIVVTNTSFFDLDIFKGTFETENLDVSKIQRTSTIINTLLM